MSEQLEIPFDEDEDNKWEYIISESRSLYRLKEQLTKQNKNLVSVRANVLLLLVNEILEMKKK